MSEISPSSWLGRFWLANSNESCSVPGVLEFNAEGASVRVEGALNEGHLLDDATVFASFPDNNAIATLYNCFGGTTSRGTHAISTRFDSTLVAIGCHQPELTASAIQFGLEHGSKWFHEKCFDAHVDKDTMDAVVRFKAFETVDIALTSELSLERFYSASVPFGGWGSESFSTKRPMRFRISSASPISIDVLWQHMTTLRRFFEFFSQHRMPYKDVALSSAANPKGAADITLRYSDIYAKKTKKFDWDEQLAPHHEIEEKLPNLLKRWFEAYQATPEPFERYFDAFGHDSDSALRFLWNAAALEELHKLRTSRSDFYYLDRLKDIRARWNSAFLDLPSDDVLTEIKDTRHYYAHAAGDLRHRAAKDWILLRYSHFLAALSNLEILSLLGLSDDDVANAAKKYWMREALSLKMFPSK